MVITYTPKKGLGTSKSEDTSVQIVTVHLKKTVVSGRVLRAYPKSIWITMNGNLW